MNLIELKNGDWVDPLRITSITICKAYEGSGFKWPNKVSVKHDGTQSEIECGSFEAGREIASALGHQVNSILKERSIQAIADKANTYT